MPIPEDAVLDDQLKVIRPLNEVKSDSTNYCQIIKLHTPKPKPEPSLKVQGIEPSINSTLLEQMSVLSQDHEAIELKPSSYDNTAKIKTKMLKV